MSETAPVKLLAAGWTTGGDSSPLYDSKASPIDVFDRIKAVSAAGFKGIGFHFFDLNAIEDQRGRGIMRDISLAVRDAGLERIELEFLAGWYGDDPRLKAAVEKKAKLLDWAALLGAADIKVGTNFIDPSGKKSDLNEIVDAFGKLCAEAQAVGTTIALELQPWNEAFSVAESLQIVKGAGNPAGGLLIDIWHATRGGLDLSGLLGEDGSWLTAVELDDADEAPRGSLMEDSINWRRFPGEGAWDVPGFIATMKRAGFDGYWGVELLSHEIRKLPFDVALRRAYDTTVRQFESVAN